MIDYCFNDRDVELLSDDIYTFNVLTRIMYLDCDFKCTDHKRFMICSSDKYHPVWIWLRDDATQDELDNVFNILVEKKFIENKYSFVTKYDHANYFINKGKELGINIDVLINMFTYSCETPIEPLHSCDGYIHKVNEADFDELVEFIYEFHESIGIDKKPKEEYKKDAKEYIEEGKTYFWKNSLGTTVASAKYGFSGDMATINFVYTKNEYRRRYYALNLVYNVTEFVRSLGFVPMLYTNADYKASNACYEKLGYKLNGKICTIKVR